MERFVTFRVLMHQTSKAAASSSNTSRLPATPSAPDSGKSMAVKTDIANLRMPFPSRFDIIPKLLSVQMILREKFDIPDRFKAHVYIRVEDSGLQKFQSTNDEATWQSVVQGLLLTPDCRFVDMLISPKHHFKQDQHPNLEFDSFFFTNCEVLPLELQPIPEEFETITNTFQENLVQEPVALETMRELPIFIEQSNATGGPILSDSGDNPAQPAGTLPQDEAPMNQVEEIKVSDTVRDDHKQNTANYSFANGTSVNHEQDCAFLESKEKEIIGLMKRSLPHGGKQMTSEAVIDTNFRTIEYEKARAVATDTVQWAENGIEQPPFFDAKINFEKSSTSNPNETLSTVAEKSCEVEKETEQITPISDAVAPCETKPMKDIEADTNKTIEETKDKEFVSASKNTYATEAGQMVRFDQIIPYENSVVSVTNELTETVKSSMASKVVSDDEKFGNFAEITEQKPKLESRDDILCESPMEGIIESKFLAIFDQLNQHKAKIQSVVSKLSTSSTEKEREETKSKLNSFLEASKFDFELNLMNSFMGDFSHMREKEKKLASSAYCFKKDSEEIVLGLKHLKSSFDSMRSSVQNLNVQMALCSENMESFCEILEAKLDNWCAKDEGL